MRKDGIDDEMYNDIKLDVMRYHVQFTLQITIDKLAEIGKTLGDLPIPSVEQIGNLAFAELIMQSQSPKNLETLKEMQDVGFPDLVLRYDESDKRDFSRIFRESIIAAVGNIKTFTEEFA